jgi:hypothetical protein
MIVHTPQPLEARIAELERAVRRSRILTVALGLSLGSAVVTGFVLPNATPDELRTKRLVVVDEAGVTRVVIGQDPPTTQRRSRSAGLTIHDSTGAERGGFSTMDDGSVVFAMDAPTGVGSPMRDRIGLVVWPNGSSYVMLLDNSTRAVAKLHSDGNGGGGVQVFKWGMPGKRVSVRTITYDGDTFEHEP